MVFTEWIVPMSIRRIVPNIGTDRMEESQMFYVELLGLRVAMDMGWIATLVSPSNPTAQISLAKGPTAQSASMTISIEVEDVDVIHTKALALGVPIVYALTEEPWGVRRFAVTDPNGVVINVMAHHK
jgi:catechol 2,3-dioxygenase-like lactoylglutathione lyase family enzyme